MYRLSLVFVLLAVSAVSAAESVEDIINFRQYSPGFASSGQPTAEQLQAIASAGFERVVYVAYSDHDNSLANEDRLAKNLGLEYVHIPVEWDAPTASDFALVAAALQGASNRPTLLHCQVNYRASAFSFLYRVLYEGVDMREAKADMNSVWEPNDTWRSLIFEILQAQGRDPNCEGCNWDGSDE